MNDTKIQWYPGFVATMNLELKDYNENLAFEKEYNLNTKPLEIDLLIIKKEVSIHISNISRMGRLSTASRQMM